MILNFLACLDILVNFISEDIFAQKVEISLRGNEEFNEAGGYLSGC
jgi:hypothetical protein